MNQNPSPNAQNQPHSSVSARPVIEQLIQEGQPSLGCLRKSKASIILTTTVI